MTALLWTVGGLLFASFLLIVFRGAPFVPTRRQDVEELFDLYPFRPDDVFVDLGSGDGRMLAAASRRGIASVGYELNPFLALYSRWMLRRLKPRPQVRLGDFWTTPLPAGTAVVFVFLAGPFMHRLDRRLEREARRLGHDITLISYGVNLPGRVAVKSRGPYLVYIYKA